MLSNVADLSDVLAGMTRDGLPVTPGIGGLHEPVLSGVISAGSGAIPWTCGGGRPSATRTRVPSLAWRACDLFLHVCSTYPDLASSGLSNNAPCTRSARARSSSITPAFL